MRVLQSIEKIIKKPYFVFYSILLFFTPLIAAQNTNELFEFPKMFFVYFLGLFIFFFFISDVLLNPVKIKRPHPLLCVLFLLTLVSTIFSSHFYTSFFGYYTRFNDGFLSYVVFFGLYFVAINKLKREDFERLIKLALFAIIPVSIYGISQYFGGTERAFSTFGQPNWMAQYLAILLPISAYFSLIEDQKNFKIWFAVYVFGFYCLWVSYSMSGILGFALGMILLFVKFFRKQKFSENIKFRVIILFAISFFIAISNLGMFGEKVNDIFVDFRKQVVVFKKVYAQEDSNKLSDPGFIRFELWKSSFNLIKSSAKVFFIGSGPETFPYVFQPFRNGKLNYSSEWDFVFNKPHNYYLEIWSESGIFALFVYVLILYLAVKKSPDFLASAFVAFAASSFFGWPVVPTSLLFWFFLSGMELDSFGTENFLGSIKIKIAGLKTSKMTGKIFLIPIWFFYVFIIIKLAEFYLADVNFKKSQDLIKKGYDDDAIYYADKSISLNPFEPSYYRGRAKVNTVFLVSSENIEDVKKSIFNDLKKAQDLNKNNLVIIRNSIPIYYFLAISDVYLSSGVDNIDEKYIDTVSEFFEDTKKNFWNDVGVVLAVAKYEKRLGLQENYGESVSRIEELRPDLLYWHELFR